jgi:hypothetical protein
MVLRLKKNDKQPLNDGCVLLVKSRPWLSDFLSSIYGLSRWWKRASSGDTLHRCLSVMMGAHDGYMEGEHI